MSATASTTANAKVHTSMCLVVKSHINKFGDQCVKADGSDLCGYCKNNSIMGERTAGSYTNKPASQPASQPVCCCLC